jgi:hypothetical protein
MMPFRALAAVLRVSIARLFGFKVLATTELSEQRHKICERCDFFDPMELQCLKCGCFTEAKTAMNTEKCPLDKWPRVWIKKPLAKRQ